MLFNFIKFIMFSNILVLLYLALILIIGTILRFINEDLAFKITRKFLSENLELFLIGYVFITSLIAGLVLLGFSFSFFLTPKY